MFDHALRVSNQPRNFAAIEAVLKRASINST